MYNYMREVLPNATLIAFTGTPLISKAKRNTYKKFGDPIHSYTMKRSMEDKITVPLVYEGRKVKLSAPSDTINAYFDSLTEHLPDETKAHLKAKYSKWNQLAEVSSRTHVVAFDIYDHFINYCLQKGLKAMVVCSSRASAVDVFNILSSIPGKKVEPRVVITFGDKREGDGDDMTTTAIKKIKDYHDKMVKPLFGDNDEKYNDSVCDDFKNPDGDINMLNKKSIDDINVKGKRVLCRCDFNVPLDGSRITDETRLVAALPTIKKLIADGGKVILCSHLGKPKGPDAAFSLAPVAKRLSELLGQEVKFAADDTVVGDNARAAVAAMNDGDVILLENTRFRPEETKNGEAFSKDLASIADVLLMMHLVQLTERIVLT